ncbi:MAG TPA: NAD-dependent epimerase/dehydratase family protein [Propionibacteriaceae bacterium]|nr:NAD-dependent epimerase/dehydratase family protein [Propionibacteriaceae bacterium]
MTDRDLHVVVGAAGATGRRVVSQLAAAGHRVRAVTRDGRDIGVSDIETVAGDGADPAAISRISAGASTIYHCAMPPIRRWRTDFPVLTDAMIQAAATIGARLVYADDTWMYGRVTAPMTAETAVRPVSQQGVLRALMAERILCAAAGGRIQASIVRAGELYGPGVRSMIADNVFRAAREGRTAIWFGDPDQPITPTFVDDFARTLAAVGTADQSAAAVWHVPHPPATTGRELALEVCRQAGTQLRLRKVRAPLLRVLGTAIPLAREAAELVYQFEQPFVVDGQPAVDAFGLRPTSWTAGIRECLGGETGTAPDRSGHSTPFAGGLRHTP